MDLARYLNDHIAQIVAENPKRFVGLGTLPMQAPDLAVKELRRCVEDLGLAGVQIGSHINDWNLDAPELFPIFEEAERLGACIFVHPWGTRFTYTGIAATKSRLTPHFLALEMVGRDRMPKYWLPWLVGMPAETCLAICSMIFSGIFEKLPKLKVCFAHGGGSFPMTVGRIDHGFHARPDLCAVDNKVSPRSYCGRFWVDSLVHDPKVLEYCVELFGPDKICLGTDYPFPRTHAETKYLRRRLYLIFPRIVGEIDCPGAVVEAAVLPRRTKDKILFGNALEFLGLNKEDFFPNSN